MIIAANRGCSGALSIRVKPRTIRCRRQGARAVGFIRVLNQPREAYWARPRHKLNIAKPRMTLEAAMLFCGICI